MAYDTDNMIYRKHKYYLTDAAILEELNIVLSKELGNEQSSGVTEAKVFRNQVTRRLYNWLFAYIRRESVRIVEKWIADDYVAFGIPFREAIEEALIAQAEYMLNFDGDFQAIDTNDMKKLVSIDAQNILITAGVATRAIITIEVKDDEWRVDY